MAASHSSGNTKSIHLLHDRIARAVFAATQSLGISDRNVAERLTEDVIQRLERGQLGAKLPLPGMENLIPETKAKGRSPLNAWEIRGIIEQALAEVNLPKVPQPSSPPDLATEPKVPILESKEKEMITETKKVKSSEPELSPNALRVLEKRYLRKDAEGHVIETPDGMFRRVAKNIASAELAFRPETKTSVWEEKFYQLMANLEFLPNSPTLMNAGRELQQLSACFVLPIEDSMESIFDAVKHTALIHKSGGGTGFSFSRLRPENDRVGSTGGIASGPVSFIRAFDTATDVIKQGGMRRGANMAILNVDHPDILKFISAKEDPKAFNNFNFSVTVTEDFIKAVKSEAAYNLINPRTKQPAGKLNARDVFDRIVDMAWKTGDPGLIFLDRVNRDNPTPQLGAIESTNPCGEQPLLPYESCNLGSINLSRMLSQKNGRVEIDYPKLARTIKLAVRFLDNVIEVNKFPLPQIERMTKATRKVGLGVMGFADMLLRLGIAYDSEEALRVAGGIMSFISKEATAASVELAEERGVFPAFAGSIYATPDGSRVRNAARTTIAPTGTLSIIANCSSGIEPLFALCYTRTILEGEQLTEVNPYFDEVAKREGFYSEELIKDIAQHSGIRRKDSIPDWVQKVFVVAHDITPEWHVRMQAAFQKFTDNAVSKTVNFPHEASREDVAKVFYLAYEEGCKGITIYRDRSRETQVLSLKREGKEEEKTTLVPRKRAHITWGMTERVSTGCGHIYVTVNSDEHGICEVFSSLGKAGGCASAQLEAISRLISLALRSGIDVPSIVKHLRGIRCPSIAWEEGHAVLSCPDAIGSVLERQIAGEKSPEPEKTLFNSGNLAGQCPECGALLIYQEGCYICPGCGYTKCG